MAMKKGFSNIVKSGKQTQPKPTTLTVLEKNDPNTIYSLIFVEKPAPKEAN